MLILTRVMFIFRGKNPLLSKHVPPPQQPPCYKKLSVASSGFSYHSLINDQIIKHSLPGYVHENEDYSFKSMGTSFGICHCLMYKPLPGADDTVGRL